MRWFFLLSVILLPANAAAQDTSPKPNTLTPKEITDGWLMLFDGESTYGWSTSVDSGKVGGDSILARSGKLEIKRFTGSTGRYDEFELQFDYAEANTNRGGRVQVPMLHFEQEIFTSLAVLPAPAKNDGNSWVNAKVKLEGKRASLTFRHANGVTTSSKQDLMGFGPSRLVWAVFNGTFYLKNVKLRPLNLQSIFNGKDLTGWHEFPGKKSKFTVTPQGAINVKDGPGDLQTEAKYDDFILQLDCISNGKHLNSGVFFRCRPNEYQNGYEAQIRNQFTSEPSQEYVIEDYDPMTHKLLGKKKEKFTAVDYGTGAIYRRVPARKEVAKDGEWFTYTILAHKNHFMTWVNGIQVVDWADNRPPSDNARNGYRQEAGHISLQGHDPTTDLSFRNFRIGVLK